MSLIQRRQSQLKGSSYWRGIIIETLVFQNEEKETLMKITSNFDKKRKLLSALQLLMSWTYT